MLTGGAPRKHCLLASNFWSRRHVAEPSASGILEADDASSVARLEADALGLALPTLLACVLPSDETRLTMTRRAATTFAKLGENKERDSEGGRGCNKPTLQSKDRGGGDPRHFPTNVFANPRHTHKSVSTFFFSSFLSMTRTSYKN
ncbi:unnamed protein product [Ixodes pacificus]